MTTEFVLRFVLSPRQSGNHADGDAKCIDENSSFSQRRAFAGRILSCSLIQHGIHFLFDSIGEWRKYSLQSIYEIERESI